jgi:hypothetical protein
MKYELSIKSHEVKEREPLNLFLGHRRLLNEHNKLTEEKSKLKICTSSDWIGDKNTRLSVTRNALLLMKLLIWWKFKNQIYN